jgi:protein-S-isoprenylcysteine O-methyltransferase Ste14
VGLLLFFGSLYLHWWARSNLQQFFGEHIEVQKDQHLIETGPYTYIRHPIYTSFFMFGFGLLMLNPALPILLVILYTFWDYGRLVNAEEKMLSDNVPGYSEYIQRTSRFFPLPGKRSKDQA